MMINRVLLAFGLLCLMVRPVSAVPRCPLDVSNPAITHTPLRIHDWNGGPGLQGVTTYAGPEEWPQFNPQLHWDPANSLPAPPMVLNELILLRDSLGHSHFLKVCFPYWAEIAGPITVPFQLQSFDVEGLTYRPTGVMIRDVVFDDGPMPLVGETPGLVTRTGHLTYDPTPFIWDEGGPSASLAPSHGWATFWIWTTTAFANGDVATGSLFLPIFMVFDPNHPVKADNTPLTAVFVNPTSPRDPGGSWGTAVIEVREPLPVLAPLNAIWPLPSLRGYSYANSPGLTGITFVRQDMDLHHGYVGTFLAQTNMGGMFPDLDPAVMGSGTHAHSLGWQVSTGPTGVAGLFAPNEAATAMLGVTITIGAEVPPPPPSDPIDCIVGSWSVVSSSTTTSPAVMSGTMQTRTVTTTVQEQRPILVQPANGGAACPVN